MCWDHYRTAKDVHEDKKMSDPDRRVPLEYIIGEKEREERATKKN